MSLTARPRPSARSAAVAALAATAAITLAACSSTSDATPGAASGASADRPTLTIAYQAIPNGDLVVKHEGWLEEALPGYAIEWKVFDSGGAVNEAFAAGSVDIGLAGSSPVSRGLSAGVEYQVPWIHDVIGSAEALVAREGIGSVADLVGTKVAVPFASTAHYSLLAALTDAGVDPSTVDIVDAEPDAINAAWTQGDIDASYVWNPVLAQLVAAGGEILTDSARIAETGRTTYDLAVVSSAFATAHPDALTTWVTQQDRAVRLYREDPDAWAAAVGAELNLEPTEVLAQAEGLIFLTADEQAADAYLGGGVAENLVATATFNKSAGAIDAVKGDDVYRDAVLTAAAAAVPAP